MLATPTFCASLDTVTVLSFPDTADGNVTDNVTSVRPESPSRTCAGANDTANVSLDVPAVPEITLDCTPGPFAFTARTFT